VAVLRLAAYLLAAALMTTLAGATIEPPPDVVAVFVETDFEIPPLAYYDGREFKPVHVAYVGEWEEAYWVGANAPVRIPTWSFKKAVIYLPREALRAKAPPNARGGVLHIYLNQTVIELVEAPPEVVATYSYHKPDEAKAPKTKAQWIKPPTKKPLDKDLDRGGEDRQSSSHQPLGKERESLHQTSTQSTTVVFPSGAFIYQQYTGWINADGEVCLNVLMPDAYILLRNPTVAAVGYNATYVWRSAWYVYTSSYGRGVVVGRGVVKAWAVDPASLDKRGLLEQWAVDLRNGYVTYTTSFSLSWPNQFVGVELCFAPYYSASYVVGANATLGFRKNAIPAAGGTYFLGTAPANRTQIVGEVTHLLRPPIRNLVFGPFSLADGYYGETLSIDMSVYVPWSAPPCPTLTVTTYAGEFGHIHLDSASFAASSYNNGLCRYEVQRSATLSPDAVGLWYDEARARDKAVTIKVSFSHPASEVKIYRVDISGRRFAENYIDKNVFQWQSLVLRGFFSQTLRACTTASLPQVNYTAALINVATYSVVWADILAVEVSGGYVVKGVRFRVKPAVAFEGVRSVYVKRDEFGESWRSTWVYEFKESWWTAWAFKLFQAVKTVLDFFGLLSGPLSWFIDRVFDLRDLTKPDMTISLDTGYVEWRAGIFDKFHQVAFEIDGSTRDRVIEIVDVRVGTDSTHLCTRSPITSPIPAVNLTARPDLQFVRHWVFGMRVTYGVPFIKS
jgi:hypothetical protein